MSNAIATVDEIRVEAAGMESQIVAALPAHIPVERFTRVVLTAVQSNPKLLRCTRKSFWSACIVAAQDGLLPDGRDGAIVPYGDDAKWMVMIGGIRKKVRNSGDIATWEVQAVYENDKFDFELGDSPRIYHKPTLEEPGKLVAVYSIATLKTGEISRDVMSVSAVEKIRKKSKARNSPWDDLVFYPEMAKKTVARRHSKVLPMSTDLDDLIRRDDELYNLAGASDAAVKPLSGGMADKMAALASDEGTDPETGEITDDRREEKPKKSQKSKSDKEDRDPPKDTKDGSKQSSRSGSASGDAEPEPEKEPAKDETSKAGSGSYMDDMTPLDRAGERGMLAAERNISRRAIPPEYKKGGAEDLKDAWLFDYDKRVEELKDA